ncbi:MAG: 2-hydroxychromene-2-carboxylate isomerase [Deltaproteobacteria bacterium]|nr:2-hydroxychromene-2-carboxylate isomerase [Deltaproteobacteria bacterium]
MPAVIRIYFDYESPNAYLAWTQLPKLAEKHGCAIEAFPVLYAGLLDAHGQLGPGEVPAKGRWMTSNFLRKAMLLGLPLNPPPFFPFNPLLALRVSLLPLEEEQRHGLIDALFKAVWVRALHVSEPSVVKRVADEIGLPGSELIERAQGPEIKALLRQQTDAAISRGVFGVPSMEAEGELFWGYDDFPYLDLFLAGNDPLNPLERQRWRLGSRPSSVRRQFRGKTDSSTNVRER